MPAILRKVNLTKYSVPNSNIQIQFENRGQSRCSRPRPVAHTAHTRVVAPQPPLALRSVWPLRERAYLGLEDYCQVVRRRRGGSGVAAET